MFLYVFKSCCTESFAQMTNSYISISHHYSTKLVDVVQHFDKYVNAETDIQGEKHCCLLLLR